MQFFQQRFNKQLFIYILLLSSTLSFAQAPMLSGKVVDAKSKQPLVGVLIYLPDLKKGAVTNDKGEYRFEQLPENNHLIQITYMGYRSVIQAVMVKRASVFNFELEYTAAELNEVVVTGLSKAAEMKRTPSPITVVSKSTLQNRVTTNIIDALAMEAGVSQVTTGAGVSKPVIRGLGYNRVVVVNDGVRQEGQQWGDEHGIEADEYDVDRVEVLKGPASLMYGSDAMAGVVNLLSAPTRNEGEMSGSVLANYQTNNGLIGYSANLGANKKGLLWDVRFSNKMAHAYQNRYDGYVYNSGFNENAIKGMLGLSRNWGYSRLSLSAYQINLGMVEGERDDQSGEFLKPIVMPDGTVEESVATASDFNSYKLGIPNQKVNHFKVVSENFFNVGKGNISAIVGFQQNGRNEYGNLQHPDEAELAFDLKTLNYNLHYNLPENNRFNLSVGSSGMAQHSANEGEEFLVPEYRLFDAGLFLVGKKNFNTIDVSGGVRFDNRAVESRDLFLDADGKPIGDPLMATEHRFEGFKTNFSGLSWSIGATWQMSKSFYTKLNLSSGFRAPNISELGSNGVHEGTLRYELGNWQLKPERSLQIDYTLGWNTEHISAEINLFTNQIDNYIYLSKLNGAYGNDSIIDGHTAFRYRSGSAQLYGGEVRFDLHPHPLDWLHIENRFAMVRAIQANSTDSTRNLPFIPAPNWKIEAKAELEKWGKWLKDGFVSVMLDHTFAQNHYFSAYGTERAAPAYTLVNATLGFDVSRRDRSLLKVIVGVNNLFDVAYQSHLSRLKYAPANLASGREGIFNMGRNISFKVIVPINL